MKIYYSDMVDIMCIVDDDKIYKYIGKDSYWEPFLAKMYDILTWYEAEVHPEKYSDFELIYED